MRPVPVESKAETPFSAGELFRRVDQRLARSPSPAALDRSVVPPYGDHSLNPSWPIPPEFLARTRTAAVLIGLVERGEEVNVLLTQRTGELRDHAGQIALPGGKMDPADKGPAETAIREAHEEVGLPPATIDVRGYLDAYLTGSGFRIIPVVARVMPPFELALNPAEVVEAFEVPFAHVMRAANYQTRYRIWRGAERAFYAIEHGERTIWGITAGILRVLYERLYL